MDNLFASIASHETAVMRFESYNVAVAAMPYVAQYVWDTTVPQSLKDSTTGDEERIEVVLQYLDTYMRNAKQN